MRRAAAAAHNMKTPPANLGPAAFVIVANALGFVGLVALGIYILNGFFN